MEFVLMLEGYEKQQKYEHGVMSFFVSILTNVHLRSKHQISPGELMKVLHPMTKEERILEERKFMEDWEDASQFEIGVKG